MASSDFVPYDTPVDHFLLSKQKSPGTAVIERASLPQRWDERAGYGLSGAISVYLGRKLSHPVARIRLASRADFAAWHAWKTLVKRPPPGRYPKALSIYHPWLAECEITSVGVEDCSQPELVDDTGIYEVTISFIEFRRPKVTLAKPEATAPDAPTDPVDKLIAKLTDQVNELAGG